MVGCQRIFVEFHFHGESKLSPLYGLYIHIGKEVLAAVKLRNLKFQRVCFRVEGLSAGSDLCDQASVPDLSGLELEGSVAFRRRSSSSGSCRASGLAGIASI